MLVHIQHNAGQLRALHPHICNQILGFRAKAARRDNAEHCIRRVHRAAREQMAHRAFAGRLIIWRSAVFLHPPADGIRRPGGQRLLQQAGIHRRHVVARRTVKALDRDAVLHADRINGLVAVMRRRFHAHDVLHRKIQTADASDRVVHAAKLHAQLLVIRHMQQAAAAAFAKNRAGRTLPVRRRRDAALRLAVHCRSRHL